jgi:hypothetical protein
VNKHLRQIAIGGSIVLHILFILFWMFALHYNLFSSSIVETVVPDPIVFELANTLEKPKSVIETPEDAEVVENQTQADFLSDKNALARNEEPNFDLPINDPFSRGDFKFEELPTHRGPIGEQPNPNEESEKPEEKNENKNEKTSPGDYYVSASEFNRDYLTNSPKQENPGMPDASPRVRYDNRDSRARDMGGLSFNTYDWNFAPYMLDLKKKVERNIFPPPAYTRLGLISGESILKFRIYPDGTMKALKLIEYNGHKTLMETSYRAIEISAPFKKLPADFPEPYLEVTAKFVYSINRGN